MSAQFQVVTGTERYRVVDLASDGVSFFDDILDAYKQAAVIGIRLGHAYQIEDRKEHWTSSGGPLQEVLP